MQTNASSESETPSKFLSGSPVRRANEPVPPEKPHDLFFGDSQPGRARDKKEMRTETSAGTKHDYTAPAAHLSAIGKEQRASGSGAGTQRRRVWVSQGRGPQRVICTHWVGVLASETWETTKANAREYAPKGRPRLDGAFLLMYLTRRSMAAAWTPVRARRARCWRRALQLFQSAGAAEARRTLRCKHRSRPW